MNTQVNWQKIRNEFQRLSDVDQLKAEVQRIGTEIRKFDYQSVLSPSAKAKVKTFERRYTVLMRTIHQAQRQMDREFSRLLRQIKGQREDVSQVVAEQKEKLEKLSKEFRQRFTKSASTAKAANNKKTTAAKKKTKTAKTATGGGARKRKKA